MRYLFQLALMPKSINFRLGGQIHFKCRSNYYSFYEEGNFAIGQNPLDEPAPGLPDNCENVNVKKSSRYYCCNEFPGNKGTDLQG